LSQDVGNSFPFLGRFEAEKPTVLTATARKAWILVVKLERGEQEIVTFAADVRRSRSADPYRAELYNAERALVTG
jgi:hypothetical protein